MFTFCIQKDTIRVQPCDFGKNPIDAIREEIHRRYANKILPNVGLVISLLDILNSSEGAVLYGDGCFYYKTEFRLIIFRPFIGEAFVGKVKSQTEVGLTITIGFFDDIIVPAKYLPPGTAFDPQRQNWFWLPEIETSSTNPSQPISSIELLNSEPSERLYIEKKDWVRIRAEMEFWDDSRVSLVLSRSGGGGEGGGGGGTGVGVGGGVGEDKGRAAYSLEASMAEAGLGVLSWWEETQEEEEEEEEPQEPQEEEEEEKGEVAKETSNSGNLLLQEEDISMLNS